MAKANTKNGKDKPSKDSGEIYLPDMFPKKVLIFSAPPLSKSLEIPYRLAKSYLASSSKKLIWISTDQPASKVLELFKEYGNPIDKYKNRIVLVDLVTTTAGVKGLEKSENVKFVENPNDMVEISMLLADLFEDEEVGLAVVDSMNGLLAFNSINTIIKFLRFLPVVANKTNTTIFANYLKGQYGPELENALLAIADAALTAENGKVKLKTRTGTEDIDMN